MGDKAYCDRSLNHRLVYPIKAERGQPLNNDELQYNDLHGFYRASIEHAFGYSKRYRIIGNTTMRYASATLFSCSRRYLS